MALDRDKKEKQNNKIKMDEFVHPGKGQSKSVQGFQILKMIKDDQEKARALEKVDMDQFKATKVHIKDDQEKALRFR